jgi:hypothetical protein
MSKKVRPLTLQMIDELQLILGAMELGDYKASLRACERAQLITDQLKAEIVQVIEERHQDELRAVKAAMSFGKKKAT